MLRPEAVSDASHVSGVNQPASHILSGTNNDVNICSRSGV